MLEAGARVDAVIFEDRDMGDPRIETQFIVAGLVNAQHVRHVAIGQKRHGLGMVGRFDNDVMHTDTLDGAPGVVNRPGWRHLAGQRGGTC